MYDSGVKRVSSSLFPSSLSLLLFEESHSLHHFLSPPHLDGGRPRDLLYQLGERRAWDCSEYTLQRYVHPCVVLGWLTNGLVWLEL